MNDQNIPKFRSDRSDTITSYNVYIRERVGFSCPRFEMPMNMAAPSVLAIETISCSEKMILLMNLATSKHFHIIWVARA